MSIFPFFLRNRVTIEQTATQNEDYNSQHPLQLSGPCDCSGQWSMDASDVCTLLKEVASSPLLVSSLLSRMERLS